MASIYPPPPTALPAYAYPSAHPTLKEFVPEATSVVGSSLIPISPNSPVVADTVDFNQPEKPIKQKQSKKQPEKVKTNWLLPLGVVAGALIAGGITLWALKDHPTLKPLFEKITGETKPSIFVGSAEKVETGHSLEVNHNTKTLLPPESIEKAEQRLEKKLALLNELSAKLLNAKKDTFILEPTQTGAMLGQKECQQRLAWLFYSGQDVTQNDRFAYVWARISDEQTLLNTPELKTLESADKVKLDGLVETLKVDIAKTIADYLSE